MAAANVGPASNLSGNNGSHITLGSSISSSGLSQNPEEHDGEVLGKGKVLFTGPDGIRDHRVTTLEERYIGIGTMSPEGTSDLSYLWRASKMTQHPPAKQNRVGSIGWNITSKDSRNKKTGLEIKVGEFRQLCEDHTGQFYRQPWYADKNETEAESTDGTNRCCSRQHQHEVRNASPGRPQTASTIAPLTRQFTRYQRPQSASSTSTGLDTQYDETSN